MLCLRSGLWDEAARKPGAHRMRVSTSAQPEAAGREAIVFCMRFGSAGGVGLVGLDAAVFRIQLSTGKHICTRATRLRVCMHIY